MAAASNEILNAAHNPISPLPSIEAHLAKLVRDAPVLRDFQTPTYSRSIERHEDISGSGPSRAPARRIWDIYPGTTSSPMRPISSPALPMPDPSRLSEQRKRHDHYRFSQYRHNDEYPLDNRYDAETLPILRERDASHDTQQRTRLIRDIRCNSHREGGYGHGNTFMSLLGQTRESNNSSRNAHQGDFSRGLGTGEGIGACSPAHAQMAPETLQDVRTPTAGTVPRIPVTLFLQDRGQRHLNDKRHDIYREEDVPEVAGDLSTDADAEGRKEIEKVNHIQAGTDRFEEKHRGLHGARAWVLAGADLRVTSTSGKPDLVLASSRHQSLTNLSSSHQHHMALSQATAPILDVDIAAMAPRESPCVPSVENATVMGEATAQLSRLDADRHMIHGWASRAPNEETASASSTTISRGSSLCKACRRPGSSVTPLVLCRNCRKGYHECCGNPKPADRYLSSVCCNPQY